ncbi:nucleoside hydrolase [Nonomuraea ferruginea]
MTCTDPPASAPPCSPNRCAPRRTGTRSTSSSTPCAPPPGEVTLVAIGPLTNIALAVRKEPRVVEWARDLVIMGGSATRGNHNPAAEFNMLADPEAAAIVFRSGWTVKMLGLDVTLTAVVTSAVLDRMRPLGRLAEFLIPAATSYGVVTADGGPTIHDACAVAYVLDPALVTMTPSRGRRGDQGRAHPGHDRRGLPADGPCPQRARRHPPGRGPLLGHDAGRVRQAGGASGLTRAWCGECSAADTVTRVAGAASSVGQSS